MADPKRPNPRAVPRPSLTLEDLRPLLVGPEQGRIQQLEERLTHVGEMVADVLPEAVTQSRKKGEALAWSLEPIVGQSIGRVVRKDPGAFAEAIAPAMGPAIRKAVAHTLRAALERFNVALERSLTLASLRWRLEARRTGRPFAEVALLRTLVYRVDEVLLIHRDTGLLLERVTAGDGPSQDPDQVSAMLSALDTFTHEAFNEDARLERFRVGPLAGWVEHGPTAILVAIVRGTAPESYEGVLREALERTHLALGKELTEFRGDTAAFAPAREVLMECLLEHHEMPRRARRISPRAVAALVAAIITIVAGLLAHRSWREHRRFEALLGALQREPGLVVIGAERRGGLHAFTGLRDPLAEAPAAALARSGLDPAGASLQFDPFYSLHPSIIDRRAKRILRPPAGVTMTYRDGVLHAGGVAPRRWIERARSAAPLLPGVLAFDESRLHEEE